MDEYLKNLWNKNRIAFFLLFPLVLIYVFKDLIMEILIGSTRKLSQKTKAKDSELQNQAEKLKQQADSLKQQADNLKVEEVDENWHVKGKK